MAEIYIHGYKLFLTCFACPEQYDVFDPDGIQIAYIRLRHGKLTVECPDVGGDLVYNANTKGDGVFAKEERMYFLYKSIEAIQNYKIEKLHEKINDFQ